MTRRALAKPNRRADFDKFKLFDRHSDKGGDYETEGGTGKGHSVRPFNIYNSQKSPIKYLNKSYIGGVGERRDGRRLSC